MISTQQKRNIVRGVHLTWVWGPLLPCSMTLAFWFCSGFSVIPFCLCPAHFWIFHIHFTFLALSSRLRHEDRPGLLTHNVSYNTPVSFLGHFPILSFSKIILLTQFNSWWCTYLKPNEDAAYDRDNVLERPFIYNMINNNGINISRKPKTSKHLAIY